MAETFRPARLHADLGPAFFDLVAAAEFPDARLRYRNDDWARRIGLGHLDTQAWLDHFAHFVPLPGSLQTPLALRYHGHQFRSYNPQLGDGRGFLFAQCFDPRDGRLLDLGTKGSGVTPWSRGGDGRLTLKGGVREILATAMLEALGVETAKSFSLVETGEQLWRNDEPSPARSAVLVRLAHSHIRIGTFQRLAYLEDWDNLRALLDYCIARYYPALADLEETERAAAFLGAVAEAVARTGARQIAAGFVHGVLNSDNINITGESFDYGPWRFVPDYDPGFTAAYFDETGLYAFGRQPDALAWNLTRLAECLVPLSAVERLEPALNRFWPAFQRELAQAVLGRLGLEPQGGAADQDFLAAFYGFMGAARPPYERVLFDWRGGVAGAEQARHSPLAALYAGEVFAPLRARIEAYTPLEGCRAHAYFAGPGPRTMLIEEMEAIWAPIATGDDWSGLDAALDAIAAMGHAYGHTPFTVN